MIQIVTLDSELATLLAIAAFYSATPVHGQERVRGGYAVISGYQVPSGSASISSIQEYGVNLEPILFRVARESAKRLRVRYSSTLSAAAAYRADLSAPYLIIGIISTTHFRCRSARHPRKGSGGKNRLLSSSD